MAKELLDDAASTAKLPDNSSISNVLHPPHTFYEDAARKAYAADLFEELGKAWETQARLKLNPNMKCRFCGGKARICYPRHLEGKSCA